MGWGMEYLAGKVIGRGIDVANAAMDFGSTIPGVRDQVTRMRASIHEVEKHMTPEHRYQGTNGGDIYTWFHEGPDPQSQDLQNAVKGWNKVSEHHKEAGDALNSAMSKIRANWQGQAGEGAANSTEPLRQSADTAHEHSRQASTTLQAQCDGFHDTKNRVVRMESEPPVASFKEMVTGNDRLDQRVGEYTETQQGNQQAFSGYGNTTGTNIQGVPNFQPAPDKPGQPGQGAQSGPGVGGQSSGLGSGSSMSPSSMSPSSTTSSGVDGGSGAHPSQPSSTQPSSGQPSAGRPDTPAASQPAFHFQRPNQDERREQQPDHSDAAPGMAGGAAGAIVGGGAIAGGSLLGSSAGGAGSGSGSGGRGLGQETGGRSGGGTPGSGGRGALGPGGQSGSGGSTPGGSAVTGGGAGGARGGAGGMGAAPPAAGGRGDDKERERPDYLTEANPHEVFGLDERVAPPVFGDQNAPNDDE